MAGAMFTNYDKAPYTARVRQFLAEAGDVPPGPLVDQP
jgi:hypothetical protein